MKAIVAFCVILCVAVSASVQAENVDDVSQNINGVSNILFFPFFLNQSKLYFFDAQ